MNIRIFTGILVFFTLFSLEQGASAKCVFTKYTITGTVQDESTRQAISNATLFFFFDDNENTRSDGLTYPDFFTTGTNGIFVATAFFDTYSGWFIFDRCNRKPKNLTVVITAPGYLTKRVIFKKKDLNTGGRVLDRTIELPAILLRLGKQ